MPGTLAWGSLWSTEQRWPRAVDGTGESFGSKKRLSEGGEDDWGNVDALSLGLS